MGTKSDKKEEERMAVAVNEVVGALKELKPLSIALMGSFARGEWHAVSDAELAVIFEDAEYRSRTMLRQYATKEVRVYPFRRSELEALKSVVPFPRGSYFWWLKNTAKTLWGAPIVENLVVSVTPDDWKEEIVFQRGMALAAMISFRNGDKQTASHGFSKSCLFATVAALALKGKEVFLFGEAVALAAEEFSDFGELIEKAKAVWQGKAEVEERDIFQNFEYLLSLETLFPGRGQ